LGVEAEKKIFLPLLPARIATQNVAEREEKISRASPYHRFQRATGQAK